MREVFIKYDPYEMITKFEVNGISVSEMNYRHQWLDKVLRPDSLMPLQSWIDPVPSENWNGLLAFLERMNEDVFSIAFCGRKTDFIDLKNSLEHQNAESGEAITLLFPSEKQQFMMDDLQMKKAIDNVVGIMLQSRFADMVSKSENDELKKKYADMQKNITAIKNKEFRVVFTGTYSTGKSTVINALLGKNVLPNSDDSCTDKICHVKHDLEVEYSKVVYINNSEMVIKEILCKNADESHEAIKGASEQPDLSRVEVYVDMSNLMPESLKDQFSLVFIDTPGTESEEGNNLAKKNAGDTHLKLTEKILSSDEKEMVVLISDKKNVSSGITKILDIFESSAASDHGCYNDRFLFVLNQCDTYDYRSKNIDSTTHRYEGLENEVLKFKNTINTMSHGTEKRNIDNPRIFPLSAAVALAIRLGCNDASKKPKKETEERSYYNAYNVFCEKLTDYGAEHIVPGKVNEDEISPNYLLDTFSDISSIEKEKLNLEYGNVEDLNDFFLLHSGILSLECAIKSYIEKYAFPLKMRKILRAFKSILDEITEENNSYLFDLDDAKSKMDGADKTISEDKKTRDADSRKKEKLEKSRKSMESIKKSLERMDILLPEMDLVKRNFYKLENESNSFFEKRPDGSLVRDITTEKAEKIKNEIEKRVIELANTAKDKVDEVKKKRYNTADNYASRFNDYIKELEKEGLLKIGTFDVKKTVQYQDIIGNENFMRYENYARDINNPNKEHIETDYGMKEFFSSLGRSLKTIFEPSTINRVDAYKYKENLFQSLEKNITNLIYAVTEAYEKDIAHMKVNMVNKMEEILKVISDFDKAIEKRNKKIKEDIKTEKGYRDRKKELEADCEFLNNLIMKLTVLEQGGN